MSTAVYNEATKTIRQIPEGYLLARESRNHNRPATWVVEPDLAADPRLVAKLALLLMNYEYKYSIGQPEIIDSLVSGANRPYETLSIKIS